MANEEHLGLLRQGVDTWNAWRRRNADAIPDLNGADLSGANLARFDLSGTDLRDATYDFLPGWFWDETLRMADLSRTKLHRAVLWRADLSAAYLRQADLSLAIANGADFGGAILDEADLSEASLRGVDLSRTALRGAFLRRTDLSGAVINGADLSLADLRDADLSEAILCNAVLRGTDLSEVILSHTTFVGTDLSEVHGLDACRHRSASFVDHRTLQRSWPLPLNFLRGVGLQNNLIDYLPSLFNQPIQFYSCFISYSSRDEDFARRLHADLQAIGVRCWFAPEDIKIGDRIRDTIDQAIRHRDKLLVILSENSVGSQWVEDEVETALEEERQSPDRRTVLFPVRIDDAVEHTDRAWARAIKRTRHIGDFTQWKDHDAYQNSFERLLRDLKPELERRPGSAA